MNLGDKIQNKVGNKIHYSLDALLANKIHNPLRISLFKTIYTPVWALISNALRIRISESLNIRINESR